MKRYLWLFIPVIGLFLSLFTACVQKPMVGKSVNYNNPTICSFSILPKVCLIEVGMFVFEFQISEGNTSEEYMIDGSFVCELWPNLDVGNSMFWLILINNGTTIDQIAFRPKGGNLTSGVPFSKSFKCPSFDAVAITYKARVTE
jgi:hypothetical protein